MPQLTTHSHSETAVLPCRACGLPYESVVWIIVDVDERPDLLARLRSGRLHEQHCPACGHAATVNAPLLVFRAAADPALLFSPARGGNPAADEEQAVALLGIFRENYGVGWRESWLAHGLTGVPREALPALLGDDPTIAAALAAAAASDDDVPPPIRRALEEVLAALAAEGVRVQSAEDLARALDERPELKARLGGRRRDEG